MDFKFIGGSMGSVVGEKISRLIDVCIKKRYPLIIISKSAGARMMEAALSLMQLAKTSAKLHKLSENKIPYLGICLGMQLLGKSSTEDGLTEGLGLIRNEVTKFDLNQLRIPHVGFNNIEKKTNNFRLLKNCNEKDNFFFGFS